MVLELLSQLPGLLSFTMHSLGVIGAGEGVFVFGIVLIVSLLHKRCDRIVEELELRLHQSDILINTVIARIESRREFVFLECLGIFLLGPSNCS